MKKTFITFLIIFTTAVLTQTLTLKNAYSQTGNLSITQVNNGSVIEVSIYIKRTGAVPWKLGFASLAFNYNFNAMNTPLESGEGIWDNNTNSQYDDQTVASYNDNKCASVEIGLNGILAGVSVPADSVLAGKISFSISNPSQNHNITWNNIYTAVIDDNGNDITSNLTFYSPQNAPLPVELASFTYTVNRNNVHLKWITANETNNYGFEVQRKTLTSGEWTALGFVNGSINSNEYRTYEFDDNNLANGNYNYRLKQTDINGSFNYLNLSSAVEIGNPDKFILSQNYPNPFNPNTVISFINPSDKIIQLNVYDMTGKLVKVLLNEYKPAGYYSVSFSGAELSSGNYIYELTNGTEKETKYMTLVK